MMKKPDDPEAGEPENDRLDLEDLPGEPNPRTGEAPDVVEQAIQEALAETLPTRKPRFTL